MATPAMGEETGIPASIMARLPPQTLAMLLDPQLSVMRLSTRMVYGKSFCETTHARARARSRKKRSKGQCKSRGR